MIAGVLLFCRDTSALPLDAEHATSIRFSVILQDHGNYTLRDPDRVQKIVRVINGLDLQEGIKQADRASDYYYSFSIHIADEDVSVELDDHMISVGSEIYQADTSELCALPEETCYAVIAGELE